MNDRQAHARRALDEFHGHEGIAESVALYRAVFPDLAIRVEDQVAQDWTVSDNAALLQQLGPRRAITLAARWLTGRLTGGTR